MQLGVERVQLGAEGRLALAQLGHAGAEFLERDQLFLVAVDQSPQRVLRAREVALEPVAAVAGGVLGAERLEPPVDLGLDQLGVLQQREHLGPDRLVDLVDANGASGADASLGAAEAVGARAAVVVVHDPGLAAGGAAVVGVAALAADEDPLQQRRLARVARREPAVAREQLLSERVLLLGDQRRHRDPQPVLGPDVLVGGATGMPASLAGHAHRLRRLAGHAPATVSRLAGVGRVAQDRPDRRRAPVRRSGPGRHALLGERPGDLDDRLALLDVAVEDLPDDRRFELVDLEERVGVLGLLDIPVAVGRVGEHRHRAGSRAMQLPATAPLGDLRALVLGDHPLELAQQLVLRRARPLGLLGEHDLDPAARELLEQQHLVGVAAREPVRRMTQHHLEAPLERPVAKPLERRAAASSRQRTRRPRRRTPPGRPARAARPAHAARRSDSESSAPGAGARRTPARRSPRPSPARPSA